MAGLKTKAEAITQKGIVSLMTDMSEREKKALFAGSVPIGLNRNQVVIGELNFNDNLYLLCTGIVRVQRVKVSRRGMGDDWLVVASPFRSHEVGVMPCVLGVQWNARRHGRCWLKARRP